MIDLTALRLRADTYAHIRAFFAERGVLEVETPILSAAGNTDPNIRSFTTHFSGHVDAGVRERWLRTSPEFPLKRLLAGAPDIYELGRVFRDGEAGGRHNPEFTMLEWYRVGWDDTRLAREVIDLLQRVLVHAGQSVDIVETTYRGLFHDALGIDPLLDPVDVLQGALQGTTVIDGDGLERDDWLDLLLTHRLQPTFPRDRVTVVRDFPASQCALARIRPGEPPVAERFEVYVGPYEVANGYHELNDAAEQRARFERDNATRRARGDREVPLDEPLLAVLDAMPDCAGVALGIERLLMVLAGTDAIADVLAFPFARA